jgi:phosphate transport system substrate-binding protein
MSRKSSFILALVVVALVATACASAPTPAPQATQAAPAAKSEQTLPAGAITLNGAGATFPDPVYTEWRFAYQYVDPSVTINYQAIGSGGGKKGIADKTIDFAGSDSLLTMA